MKIPIKGKGFTNQGSTLTKLQQNPKQKKLVVSDVESKDQNLKVSAPEVKCRIPLNPKPQDFKS